MTKGATVEEVEVVGTCVCIIICPDQDTMHEAALGAPHCVQFGGSFSNWVGAREWCSVGQDVRNVGTCLECGGGRGL